MHISDALRSLKQERAAIAHGIGNTEAHLKYLREKLRAIDNAITALEPLREERLGANTVLRLDAPENAAGITDSVRAIFKLNQGQYLTPKQVRDALRTHGLMKGYDNEMAVVHQIVNRLRAQGQLTRHATEKSFRWNTRNSGPRGRGEGVTTLIGEELASKVS